MSQPAPLASAVLIPPCVERTTTKREHFLSKCVMGLSIPQIIIGILSIIFQSVLISERSAVHFVGQGIWAGAMCVVTGSLGIASSKTKSLSIIVAFLTVSILSAVLTIGLLTASAIDFGITNDRRYGYGYTYGRYDEDEEQTRIEIMVRKNTILTLSMIMVVMALVEAVLAILSSAYACHGLCGGNQKTSTVTGQVQYVTGPNGQQQVIIIPNGIPPSGMIVPNIPQAQGWEGQSNQGGQVMQPPNYNGQASAPPEYNEEYKGPL